MPRLSLFTLGAFQVVLNDQPVVGFGYNKVRALLAYLAVMPERPHRREALAALLWPEQTPKAARHSLSQAVLKLRQALKDQNASSPFISADRDVIHFDASDVWVDALDFAALLDQAAAHAHLNLKDCAKCVHVLESAVALYRGEFLHGLTVDGSIEFDEWVMMQREHVHLRVIAALHDLTQFYASRGKYDRAQQFARRQVALEPYREEAHRDLMQILARSGQRSAALAQYQTCRRILAEELNVEPDSKTQALYQRILAAGKTSPHNLPAQVAPLIGRQDALMQIAEHLAGPDCRLLTITGIGGVGKTRLALEAAREHVGVYLQGVFFVPLAAVATPDLIVGTIIDSLGVPLRGKQTPEEALLAYLTDKNILLVLDNFEHLLDGAPLVTRIMQQAPHVDFLMTSRENLNLSGETCLALGGLPVERGGTKADEISPAAALFVTSARRLSADFQWTQKRAPHIVRICELTQGIPLIIEMAASWTALHSCEQIAREIAADMDYLSSQRRDLPPRHRSVRAVFDHSWGLLSPEERKAARKLAVFRDAFASDAAHAISGATAETLRSLSHKSFLQHGEADFWAIHPALKQYLAEKLAEEPEEARRASDLHCAYYAVFLHERGQEMRKGQNAEACKHIELVMDDVRAAWDWASIHQKLAALRKSFNTLFLFYELRSRFSEGTAAFASAIQHLGEVHERAARQDVDFLNGLLHVRLGRLYVYLEEFAVAENVLKRALELLGEADVALDISERASALGYLGIIARRRGEYQSATAYTRKSLALSRQCGDQEGIAFCLNLLGSLHQAQGEYAQAWQFFEENLALRKTLGDMYGAAIAGNNLGNAAQAQGMLTAARKYYEDSYASFKELDHPLGMAAALTNAGYVAWKSGDYAAAMRLHLESLEVKRGLNQPRSTAITLSNLAETACSLGKMKESHAYFREALALAVQAQATPLIVEILVGMAVLFQKTEKRRQAAELLQIARQHPASTSETKARAANLSAELDWGEIIHPRALDTLIGEILEET